MTYEDIKRGQIFSLRLKAKTKKNGIVILDMILPGIKTETLRWPEALCKFLKLEKDVNHTDDDEQTYYKVTGKSPEDLD